MMRILIVPDKFKGSLTAQEVCAAVEEGIHASGINAKVKSIPLADGGEGTCAILTNFFRGKEITIRVHDPLGRIIQTSYGISDDLEKAFIEMSSASGLQLLKARERNPLMTSTVGVGELIDNAVNRGVKEVIVGIGGSATNDAGIGMATALGYRFLDKDGNELSPTGENLQHINEIREPSNLINFRKINFTILCDVKNPLFGKDGAAFTFGPQKGADPNEVERLDKGLRHFNEIVKSHFKIDLNFPGAGAGGGMGAGCFFFLKGKLTPGIDYIMEVLSVEEEILKSELVITGEGKLDEQSLSGKVVSGISQICMRLKKNCIIVTGKNTLKKYQVEQLGDVKVLSLVDAAIDETYALANGYDLIKRAIQNQLSVTS
jgi:glycerate 2-kinase